MAQSVERRIGSAEVTGSIPVSSFYLCHKQSPKASKTKVSSFLKKGIHILI